MVLIGLMILVGAVLNVGCCGKAGCPIPSSANEPDKDIKYEKVDPTK